MDIVIIGIDLGKNYRTSMTQFAHPGVGHNHQRSGLRLFRDLETAASLMSKNSCISFFRELPCFVIINADEHRHIIAGAIIRLDLF